jgi:O-antigen ligase
MTGIAVMEGAEFELMGVQLSNGRTASGPFVNRNHFANYLVLTLCAGLGLLISMQSRHAPGGWRQRLRQWATTLLGPKARLRIFLALIVITLVLTRSRMGNTAFFASLLVAGGFALALIRGRQRSLAILIASLVAIDIMIVGTWFGVEQVVDRVQKSVTVNTDQIVIHDEARMEANREAMNIIAQSPWSGTGAGTWFTVFPQWRTADHGFFDHAHNDYFEFAVDLGLPATFVLLLLVALSVIRALLQLARRSDPLVLGAAFSALMAACAMALHATVDFSLHIPANGVVFVLLMTLPWLHAVRSRKSGAGGAVPGK